MEVMSTSLCQLPGTKCRVQGEFILVRNEDLFSVEPKVSQSVGESLMKVNHLNHFPVV